MLTVPIDPRYIQLRALFPPADRPPSLAEAARIQREIGALLASGTLPAALRPLRIACLRSVTVEPLLPQVVATLAHRDFAATIELGGLGNVLFEVASADSFLYSSVFDVCIILVSAESVLPRLADPEACFDDMEATLQVFLESLNTAASRFPGLIVLCNFAPPGLGVGRRFQSQDPASSRYAVSRANRLIAARVQQHARMVLCDLEYLSQQLGREQFYSARNMSTVMQPFSPLGFHRVCQEWADLCQLHFRGPAKCVVLDCDNTLWHGIIGEDGLHGIRLGEGYPGTCYQQFQRQLKQLKNMGFLLAINSKNNEADVRAVFDEHPAMVLKYDDFAAVRANWESKGDNMASIAEELNLGLESFLFIDDNPFEIEQVKAACAGVACVQVPSEPWKLPEVLPSIVRLDRLAITAEDRKKSEMYRQERQRKAVCDGTSGIEDYLRQLDLEMTIESFQAEKHLDRVVQLLQKTNQFNLTTRRHDAGSVLAMARSGAMIRLASLRDRFGDYGRIALAIVTFAGGVAWLDTFLMSCRAIGRRAETMFLTVILEQLRKAGCTELRGEYLPSPRNQVCEKFLPEHGFHEIGGRIAPEGRCFERDLAVRMPEVESFYELTILNN